MRFAVSKESRGYNFTLMRKPLLTLLLVVGICGVWLALAPGSAQAAGEEPWQGESVCLPDAYLQTDNECVVGGPAQVLTDLARKGMSYPLRPLPARKPPVELTISPVNIAKINLPGNEPANLYASLDDAVAGGSASRSIGAGDMRYVSYINVQEVNGNAYVQLKSGEWMRASPAGYPRFQGLVFDRTPANSVGWMVDHARARSAPGYANPEVGDTLLRETAVQIYDVQPADGVDWYQIGPDQWMERRYIRQLRINTTPPEGVTGGRWIDLNLYDQTVGIYDNYQLVFATMVATGGEPFYTRPGLFPIYEMKELETMQGAFEADRSDFYYFEDVPWTMYFDQARALHGAYWRAWFGYAGTHGCVNFSIGDAAWVYQWAKEGDWVYVWDPSGETPTDPALYGAGGA